MPRKKAAVTLKDIAKQTGYSVNTVSRALRDKDDIAPETKERIKQIAMEMGHVNNTLAASLRLGYTRTVAVILGDISNPHFAIMMKEIEAHAREYGYSSILFNTNENEEQELEAIRSALNKNVDGIIICPAQRSSRSLKYLEKTGVPFVLIGRRDENYSYVVCNDELGGYQATKALLDAGHRDILLLHGARYISSARERIAGYRRAYAEVGIPVNEKLIREVKVTADGERQSQGAEAAEGTGAGAKSGVVVGSKTADSGTSNVAAGTGNGCRQVIESLRRENISYTAIFAFSDMLAWEAWCVLREQGIEVPRDCSLVGFDHIQSRMSIPYALTTISSYKGRMSATTVDVLIRLMDGDSEKEQIMIDTALAEGETIAAV